MRSQTGHRQRANQLAFEWIEQAGANILRHMPVLWSIVRLPMSVGVSIRKRFEGLTRQGFLWAELDGAEWGPPEISCMADFVYLSISAHLYIFRDAAVVCNFFLVNGEVCCCCTFLYDEKWACWFQWMWWRGRGDGENVSCLSTSFFNEISTTLSIEYSGRLLRSSFRKWYSGVVDNHRLIVKGVDRVGFVTVAISFGEWWAWGGQDVVTEQCVEDVLVF